jgi:glycosyltransferase involved in cell wall biosynthesis
LTDNEGSLKVNPVAPQPFAEVGDGVIETSERTLSGEAAPEETWIGHDHLESDPVRLAESVVSLKAENARLLEQVRALRSEVVPLKRLLEIREVRIAAQERKIAGLSERGDRVRDSIAYRLGEIILAAGRSFKGFCKLPRELIRLHFEIQRRKTEFALRQAEIGAPAPQGLLGSDPANPSVLTMPNNLRDLKIACVMDEFTQHSFAPECTLLPLDPAQWQAQVEDFRPDLVFIESAWRGLEGKWSQKVSNPSPEIMGLIDWCVKNRVPSMFWNKEDPVHFGGFQHIARAVDYVFTTDIDCIEGYRRAVGHDRVYLLPFAAQPASHNPIERFERQDAFCFAGSYYLKYPERQRDFRNLIDMALKVAPVEIYDRNFLKPHPHYEFPPEYSKYILGSLPFDEIDKAYKGYVYGINMNTIKQSQTMFARRVYELLACNTIVVSNYSRGMRLLFGDLVVSSDDAAELSRRLSEISRDASNQRRYRLAGVRKVMAEHCYCHRLAFIASKMSGADVQAPTPEILVLAQPADAAEAARIRAAFLAQSHENRRLVMIGRVLGEPLEGEKKVEAGDGAALLSLLRSAEWVAPWSGLDHYGANYLRDLALGVHYCGDADAIGKACFHDASSGEVRLIGDGRQYREAASLAARSMMARGAWLAAQVQVGQGDVAGCTFNDGKFVSLDEFNYCRNAAALALEEVACMVDDLPGLHLGASLEQDIYSLTQSEEAISSADLAADVHHALSGEELFDALPARMPSGIGRMLSQAGALEFTSVLAPGKHVYSYLRDPFTREQLNLVLNSRYEAVLEHIDAGLDLRTVFEFLDESKVKISHSIQRSGSAQSLAIPPRCAFVRIGFRIQGAGTARIAQLVLDDIREKPNVIAPTAPNLVIAKQYPAYDDLYRYGFVHSRSRGYRERGRRVEIFRINNEERFLFREFNGVDVIQGDQDLLDLALRSGSYKHVSLHLVDPIMWEVVRRHLNTTKVTVWIHGAEVQSWQRRVFEFDDGDEAEVEHRKRLSDNRMAFCAQLFSEQHPNLSFVFVSRTLMREVEEDLGMDLSGLRHEVIHNFIDGGLFSYHPKDPEQRKRILSIRPFASRVYGNDLTVEAIRLLADKPFFPELSFRIIGDGDLFDDTVAPLAAIPNVTVEKRFVTQQQIAQFHREHGVFLCPSRADTQGVSRDEAMASGLVPVTNAVSAIPEFVDEGCGLLAEAENAQQLADAIERLYHDPELFLRLSAKAAQRVRGQSGAEQTIGREIEFIS